MRAAADRADGKKTKKRGNSSSWLDKRAQRIKFKRLKVRDGVNSCYLNRAIREGLEFSQGELFGTVKSTIGASLTHHNTLLV